jgi:hypothetical protein
MSVNSPGFDPGSIVFPENILMSALGDAISALPERDAERIGKRSRTDTLFQARARKVIADFAVMMMLAKSVDEERKFKSFLDKVRSTPEQDQDCVLLVQAMISYSRSEPTPKKGVPAFVKHDIYKKRIDVVERNLCGRPTEH